MEIRDHVTGAGQTTNKQWKIGLLSQWKLEAEFRKKMGERRAFFLTKIRALDGRKDGRRRAKFKFLFYAIFMQFTEVKLH